MVRLFVALDFPPEIRAKLWEPQAILKTSRARLALVDPEIIHITLKFIGEVSPDQKDQIEAALHNIRCEPFEVRISGIGANDRRKPRVIWCTIEDGGKSAGLHDLIENALAPLGITRDNRAFRPHATLARVKSFDPTLISRMREIPPADYGSFTARCWQLKKSTLTLQGPVYETLMEVSCA